MEIPPPIPVRYLPLLCRQKACITWILCFLASNLPLYSYSTNPNCSRAWNLQHGNISLLQCPWIGKNKRISVGVNQCRSLEVKEFTPAEDLSPKLYWSHFLTRSSTLAHTMDYVQCSVREVSECTWLFPWPLHLLYMCRAFIFASLTKSWRNGLILCILCTKLK